MSLFRKTSTVLEIWTSPPFPPIVGVGGALEQSRKRFRTGTYNEICRVRYKVQATARLEYIATPEYLANKHCIINVQNDDQKCFYGLFSLPFINSRSLRRAVSHYRKYENELNVDNPCFPTATKDVPKFEEINSKVDQYSSFWRHQTRTLRGIFEPAP